MPGNNPGLIDTNILVYAFVESNEPGKRKAAKGFLDQCLSWKSKFAVSLQNIFEFYSVATTKFPNPLPVRETREISEELLAFDGLMKISPTAKALVLAMKLHEDFRISYWDCLITATMLENGIFTIYTENVKDFSKIPGIKVINPFA